MPAGWWIAALRLAGLLCFAGLAASRLGLLLHELGGHGGFAIAQGGEVVELHLFWFAGGWISYSIPDVEVTGALLATLGGIIVEFVIGIVLWFGLARRDRRATETGHTPLGIRIVRGIGAALIGHACWYFSTGTWHGYGDGNAPYRLLEEMRYPVAIAAGLVTCVAAFAGARLLLGAFLAVLPGPRRAQLGGLAVALATSLALLGLPVLIEVQVRVDPHYKKMLRPEGERLTERELLAWQREMQRRGATIDPAARAAEAERLAARHREPPFMPVLAVMALLSIVIGAWRARPAPGAAVTRRQLAIAAIVGLGSLAAVIAIEAAFN